jgi:hypothetical protein
MEEIEVQVIGCEAAETAFTRSDSAAARRVAWQHLANQENFLAAASDGFANQLFGATIRVHFRGID